MRNRATVATDPSGEIVIFVHGINDDGNPWMQQMHTGMLSKWAKGANVTVNGVVSAVPLEPQVGVRFSWRTLSGLTPGPNTSNTTNNAHATIKETLKDPATSRAVTNLIFLVENIRKAIPPNCREPINILGYSQGTMITLAALTQGLRINNAVFINSPLHTTTGANDVSQAIASVSGNITFYWSPDDAAVKLINGSLVAGGVNLPVVGINNIAGVFQVQIAGNHGATLTETALSEET